MTFAMNDQEELCEASPKTNLKCPNCKKDVFSKCGDIRIWHWSHHVNQSCEFSKIRDSRWRYEWITKTSKEKAEKLINGKIADVLGNNDAKVIFIDHKIDTNEISEKENAFKDKIIWVIKSDDFKYLKFYSNDHRYDQQREHYSFSWKRPRSEWITINRSASHIFFDVGNEKYFYSNSFDKKPRNIITNRLLYVKELKGDEYEFSGRAVEVKEEFFIDRYM
jgi:competence protein CoiA